LATTRVFQSGNSQSVRLPVDFRMEGPEVEIFRRGDEIVLREIRRDGLAEAFNLLAELPIADIERDGPPQEREGL
jgi:antitoxin VapB